MNLVVTNPLGFLALLGIPAVVLIHFLQRQARVIPISTLFLLAQTQRESVSGRRFDRLTNSIPLWLQLLMVLLLTWLLIEPRYIRPASTQQVAVVLDSSASMSVFKEDLVAQLEARLPGMQGVAAKLDLYVFESEPERPMLYGGDGIEDALAAITAWVPSSGTQDPAYSLRLARSRIKREGVLVYATDTPVGELPFDAQLLSVGEPRANVGFTGSNFKGTDGRLEWQAVIRNYSDQPQSRTWSVLFPDGSQSEPRTVELPANGMTTITSAFPEGASSLRVTLSGDDFPLDDGLPLVRPAPKALNLLLDTSPKFTDFASRLSGTIPNMEIVNDDDAADLTIVTYDPLLPALPETDAIVLLDDTTTGRRYLNGGIVAEKHPLMEGLNWQALLVRDSIQMELTPSDEVLLWQGPRPLIALRSGAIFESPGPDAGGEAPPPAPKRLRQLILNFDPTLSNAFKLPATVVLLHRFCEDLRTRKIAPEAANTETGQRLALSFRTGPEAAPLRFAVAGPDGEELDSRLVPSTSAGELRAPSIPGFFRISQGEEPLLYSACHFADTREADLRSCDSTDRITASGVAVDLNTREDHFWRIWTLLVIVALFLAWYYTRERPRDEHPEPAPPAPAS